VLHAVGDYYGAAPRYTRRQHWLGEDLHAVMIFTSRPHHAPRTPIR